MKTPDEIKKGLEQCANTQTCEKCHYRDDCMELYSNKPLTQDALAYIQQIENKLKLTNGTKEKVQMKTVDMARENNFVLREAAKAACDGYYTHLTAGGKGDPAEERWIEALTAGADAITLVAVLESRLAQAERERDAAVIDLRLYAGCKVCKHGDFEFTHECMDCSYDNNNWEWRGVCEETTKGEDNG